MLGLCSLQFYNLLSLGRFLNQAMKMFDATEVVPINFVFFTASAIVAGMSPLKASLFAGIAPHSLPSVIL